MSVTIRGYTLQLYKHAMWAWPPLSYKGIRHCSFFIGRLSYFLWYPDPQS